MTFNAGALEWASAIAARMPSARKPSAEDIAGLCMKFALLRGLTPSDLDVTPLWIGAVPNEGAPTDAPDGTRALALLIRLRDGATFQLVGEDNGDDNRGAGLTATVEPGGAVARSMPTTFGNIQMFGRSIPWAAAQTEPLPWLQDLNTSSTEETIYVADPGASSVKLETADGTRVLASTTVNAEGLATFSHVSVSRTPGAVLAASYDANGKLIGSTPIVGTHDFDPFGDHIAVGGSAIVSPSP